MKLRELPLPEGYDDRYTEEQVRAIQRDAMCDTLVYIANWIEHQRLDVPAHGWEFAEAIRELEIRHAE